MKSVNDLWEDMGSIEQEEMPHVMTKLFSIYEEHLKLYPNSEESLQFFKNLDRAITETSQCNLNRR